VFEVAPRRDVSADAQTNEIIEHPPFSTNIFDGRESEPEPEPELQQEQEPQVAHPWFWFCTVIAIFCFGVASSYYIIHL